MGIFDNAEELERKEKLRKLEDKRLAFAQELEKQGFAPEKMLFAQSDKGGFVAFSRDKGQYALVTAPGPNYVDEEDFRLIRMDALNVRRDEIHVASEGMGGIFGFGKKAQIGVEYVFNLPDGGEVRMPFVGGRNGWMERERKKNPLLSTKRRKRNDNLSWEMSPLDSSNMKRVLDVVETYFIPNSI